MLERRHMAYCLLGMHWILFALLRSISLVHPWTGPQYWQYSKCLWACLKLFWLLCSRAEHNWCMWRSKHSKHMC